MDGHFQEYRRPQLNGEEQRDNQNRSIQCWIKPGTVFTSDLHIANLSVVELGALLWLLSLPADYYHRLGGGKPLGFGSVRLEIDAVKTRLSDGNGWKTFYSTLGDMSSEAFLRQKAIDAFQAAVVSAYGQGQPFDQVSFIGAIPPSGPRVRRQSANTLPAGKAA